ncbi:MAG: hypothetical protein Q8L48_00460 [Archangium sp.]|nr:hypothetical protein [Archangium sp.]
MRAFTSLLVFALGCGALPSTPDAGIAEEIDAGIPDAGSPDAGGPALEHTFTSGRFTSTLTPRSSEAGFKVLRAGDRTLTFTITRHPDGSVSRRLRCTDANGERWSRAEAANERLTDFTVHPSGDISLGLERLDHPRDAFELIRLDPDGRELHRQVLARPATIPAGDQAAPFRMKGVQDGSVVTGWLPWLRLEARGEDLVLGLLSRVETPDDGGLISAVVALQWAPGGGYGEQWARVVDARHSPIAIAWQFDEFLWLDAATRLLVSVRPDGSVLIGRTLALARCRSLQNVFAEIGDLRCRQLGSLGSPHRYQPFAVTTFSPTGARLGTRVLAPEGLEEFVIFDFAARGDQLAVAGTAVRRGPDGEPPFYFEPPSGTALSPYDGYLAVLELTGGAVVREQFIDLGRAEHLVTVKWTGEGLVAGGGANWNRWSGGMSLSRSADPLLVFDSLDAPPLVRALDVAGLDRHALVWSLDVRDAHVLAVGQSDAPMTHSGDADPTQLVHGGLTLELQ